MWYLDDIINILNKHCVSHDYITADVVYSQLKYLPDENKIKNSKKLIYTERHFMVAFIYLISLEKT